MTFDSNHLGYQSAFAHLPPEELLQEMMTMVEVITADHQTMLEGLAFLLSEAKKSRIQRNQRQVRVVWDRIEPLLRTFGIMDHFDREPMRGKMLSLLRGNS